MTPDLLRSAGVVRTLKHPIKILGKGELSTRLTVTAHAFSKRAVEADRGGRRHGRQAGRRPGGRGARAEAEGQGEGEGGTARAEAEPEPEATARGRA